MKYLPISALAFLLAVTAVLQSGCDTQSAAQRVIITPSSAVVHRDQSVTFTATGGFDYEWSLSDNTLGTLSSRTGPTVTYTSLTTPNPDATSSNPANSSVAQVLTVVSTIEGSSQGSDTSDTTTNAVPTSARTSVSASAVINHR